MTHIPVVEPRISYWQDLHIAISSSVNFFEWLYIDRKWSILNKKKIYGLAEDLLNN